jgi:hypothetical protein
MQSIPYQWVEVDDPARDEFVLSMPGATIECTRDASGLCAPHVEEAFVRVTHHPQTQTFTVWDKSGTKFTFGEANRATDDQASGGSFNLPARTGSSLTTEFALTDAEDAVRHPQCSYIFSWALTSVEDPYGNRMEFKYRLLEGVLHPHSIAYGGNVAASQPHMFNVAFNWEDRPTEDRPSSSIGGFRARLTKRLDTVAVTYNGQSVRAYDLAYADDRRGRQSMLATVVMKGTDGTSVQMRADGGPAAAAFAYRTLSTVGADSHAAKGFDNTIQRPTKPTLGAPANALRWYDDGETKRDVFDITGDGFADLVDTASCGTSGGWAVYLGSKAGFSNTATCWHLSSSLMSVVRGKGDPLANPAEPVQRATLDLLATALPTSSTPGRACGLSTRARRARQAAAGDSARVSIGPRRSRGSSSSNDRAIRVAAWLRAS